MIKFYQIAPKPQSQIDTIIRGIEESIKRIDNINKEYEKLSKIPLWTPEPYIPTKLKGE